MTNPNLKFPFGELFEAISEALQDGKVTIVEVYQLIRLLIQLLKK